MTKQNVVVSDVKSGIGMSIKSASGDYVSISIKNLLKQLKTGCGDGGARVNAFVDSLRAASPTHNKSSHTPSLNLMIAIIILGLFNILRRWASSMR